MVGEITNEPHQLKEIPITFKYNGEDKRFRPKPDLTPHESIKIMSVMMAGILGENVDTTYFIDENNLHRHFGISIS